MNIDLLDVQTGFGGIASRQPNEVRLEELIDEMKRLSISRALVRWVPDDLERDWPHANEELFAAAASHRELIPCPVVAPSSGGDFPPEEDQVAALIGRGAGAAWARAEKDYWLLKNWASGLLFRELEARRLPLFCLERDVKLADAADLAREYPRLPIIVAGFDYRAVRTISALLETFRNIQVSIGNRFSVEGGIEYLVSKVGARRLLFGTGFPESEAMMAVTMLLYADISDDDKVLIGSRNFERLMEAIVR